MQSLNNVGTEANIFPGVSPVVLSRICILIPLSLVAFTALALPDNQASQTYPKSQEVTGEWVEATPSAEWYVRGHHTSVVFNEKIWVLGGSNADYSVRSNDVWWSEDGANWYEATDNANWAPRRGHTSVVFNQKIWVMGGSIDGQFTNDVWWSEDGTNWTQATPSAEWYVRGHHTSVVFNEKIWVMGGLLGTDFRENDVWWSEDGVNWFEATSNAAWGVRSSFTALVFDNKMWVMGGVESNLDNLYHNDVWWSTDGSIWQAATLSANWTRRAAHASVVYDNKMWVLGGGFLDDMWWSDDGATWWQVYPTVSWTGRHAHGAVVFKNTMWVTGGYSNGYINENDVWYWSPTPSEGEGEVSVDGEGETPVEGEGEVPTEGEVVVEGEGEVSAEGEGEVTAEGEGEVPTEGEVVVEGEVLPEGEGEVPAEGEGEVVVEGEVLPEGEDESNCNLMRVQFETEWPLMAADLGLNDYVPAAGSGKIPERWGLQSVLAVACKPEHPHHDRMMTAYLTNVASLEAESSAVVTRIEAYKHALAGILLINRQRCDYFIALLGLQNEYEVAHGTAKSLTEPFSEEGDLDYDLYTNLEEYQVVVLRSGSWVEYAIYVLTPGLYYGMAMPLVLWPAVVALLALGAVAVRRRE